MSYDQNNVFAKILRGELPCHKLYEDEKVLAFLDILPINPGHLLVIPKYPSASFDTLPPDYAAAVATTAQRLGSALRRAQPQCRGLNYWVSDGAEAGQEVPHVHMHVVPRWDGDGFGFRHGPQNRVKHDADTLAAMAEQVRVALNLSS